MGDPIPGRHDALQPLRSWAAGVPLLGLMILAGCQHVIPNQPLSFNGTQEQEVSLAEFNGTQSVTVAAGNLLRVDNVPGCPYSYMMRYFEVQKVGDQYQALFSNADIQNGELVGAAVASCPSYDFGPVTTDQQDPYDAHITLTGVRR